MNREQSTLNAVKARYRLLDILRGFSSLSMIAYHLIYNIVVLYNVKINWFVGTPGYLWQQSICWVFILVSGSSLHFARSALRQGVKIFACGIVVTLVTLLAVPNLTIWFGILHFMGAATIMTAAIQPFLNKVSPSIGFATSFALFWILKGIPQGYIGFGDVPLVSLPKALYNFYPLFFLGFPSPNFSSSDYFPIIPWIFLFWAGYFGWTLLQNKQTSSVKRATFIERIGQHSLLIYMLHQPILYGILLVISRSTLL